MSARTCIDKYVEAEKLETASAVIIVVVEVVLNLSGVRRRICAHALTTHEYKL